MPFPLIAAAIMGGSSLLGGIFSRNAAKNAAKAQQQAATDARNLVQGTTDKVNPWITDQANDSAYGLKVAADQAGWNLDAAGVRAGNGVRNAARDANGILNPYNQAGTDALSKLQAEMDGPKFEDDKFVFSQNDPSYQFRLNEGLKALQKSGAARGGVQSGGMFKALEKYGSNLASTEYQAEFNRHETEQNNRFDRFIKQKGLNLSSLTSLAGIGANAGAHMGDNLIGAETYAGNVDVNTHKQIGDWQMGAEQIGGNYKYDAAKTTAGNQINSAVYGGNAIMGAGNAKAAGEIGAGNAWANMFGQFAGAASPWLYKDLFKTPSYPSGGSNTTSFSPYFQQMGVN